jgi:hypothetical protein
MAIQKIKVTGDSLPLITSNGKYFLRYRVVSSDGSLTSAWSTLYEFDGNQIPDFTGTETQADTLLATVNPDKISILLQWESIGTTTTESALFDVFAKWSYATDGSYAEDYSYKSTVSSTNFSIAIPSGARFGSFVVQLATQDKAITSSTISSLGVGEVEISTSYVSPDIDGGTI